MVAVVTGSSCTKKLNERVFSEDTPGNFYQTSDQVVSAYVLPYSYLQTHIYQVHFQDVEFVTDEACVPVLFGYVDQGGQWIRFHQHTWASPDPWILQSGRTYTRLLVIATILLIIYKMLTLVL